MRRCADRAPVKKNVLMARASGDCPALTCVCLPGRQNLPAVTAKACQQTGPSALQEGAKRRFEGLQRGKAHVCSLLFNQYPPTWLQEGLQGSDESPERAL